MCELVGAGLMGAAGSEPSELMPSPLEPSRDKNDVTLLRETERYLEGTEDIVLLSFAVIRPYPNSEGVEESVEKILLIEEILRSEGFRCISLEICGTFGTSPVERVRL